MKKMLDLLYRSFDSKLTEEEQRQLDEALSHSGELRKEKEHIARIRGSISASAPESFRPFFAERVMQRITSIEEKEAEKDLFTRTLFVDFRRVALIAAMLIIMLLSHNLIQSGDVSLNGAFAVPEITFEEVFEPTLALNVE